MIEVRYEKERKRAAAYDGEKQVGECEYAVFGDVWNVYHTGVDPNYGGRGIAGDLVECVVDAARSEQKRIIPSCSYVRKAFDKRADYRELLAEER